MVKKGIKDEPINSPYVTEKLQALKKLYELNLPFFKALQKSTPWNIVDRASWGAQPPVKEFVTTEEPVSRMVLTYRTSPALPCHTQQECIPTVKKIQQNHFRRGMSDIAYNFLIGGDGSVYEGRGWGVRSSMFLRHPHAANRESDHRLDVAFIGDHVADEISFQMFTAAVNLAHIGSQKNYVVRQWMTENLSKPEYGKEKFVKRDNRVTKEKIKDIGDLKISKENLKLFKDLIKRNPLN